MNWIDEFFCNWTIAHAKSKGLKIYEKNGKLIKSWKKCVHLNLRSLFFMFDRLFLAPVVSLLSQKLKLKLDFNFCFRLTLLELHTFLKILNNTFMKRVLKNLERSFIWNLKKKLLRISLLETNFLKCIKR